VRPATSTNEAVHRAHPWRVHTLCADFTLLDVWKIPVAADQARGERFVDFYRLFVDNGIATDSRVANALFALRFGLGRLFHLDAAAPLPIPGCREASVSARLTEADLAANRIDQVRLPEQPVAVVPIYLFEDEALLEISNRTIHALLHLGWVDAPSGAKTVELAVYIKSRGRLSDLYMALIKPFRHALVYPPWIARLCRLWREAQAANE
jgi:hypothetical protein